MELEFNVATVIILKEFRDQMRGKSKAAGETFCWLFTMRNYYATCQFATIYLMLIYFCYNLINSTSHYYVLYIFNLLFLDFFYKMECCILFVLYFLFFSLPRPYFPIVLSIEKIGKNTDIKFPQETDDNKQQLQTHFMLPQGALKNMTGIPHEIKYSITGN